MASKRGLNLDKRQSAYKGRIGPLPPADADRSVLADKSENVDELVSEFLEQLSNISSEIGEGSPRKPELTGIEIPRTAPKIDTREIEQEIEQSLSELERLKALRTAAPVIHPDEKPATESEVESQHISEEQPLNLNMLELYRNSISAPPKSFLRRRGALIGSSVAALVLVATIFFFSGDNRENEEALNTETTVVPVIEEPAASTPLPETFPSTPAPAEPVVERTPTVSAATGPRSKPESTRVSRISADSEERSDSRVSPVRLESNEKPEPPEVRAAVGSSTQTSPVWPEPQPAAPPQPAAAVNAATSRPEEGTSGIVPVVDAESQPKLVPSTPEPVTKKPPVVSGEVRSTSPAPKPAETSPVSSPPPAAAKPTGPRVVRSTPVAAEAIKRVQPAYPPLARAQNVSGTVEVEADINEEGDVVRVKAVAGPILLRAAAEEALLKWKFRPASTNGIDVASKARVKMTFSIK